jgi:stage III sporulation protein AC
MNIEVLFQIAAVGIIVTVLDHVLRRADRQDIAALVTTAGVIVVLLLMIDQFSSLLNTLRSVFRV